MSDDSVLRLVGPVITALVAVIGLTLTHLRERDKLRTLERLTDLVQDTPEDAKYFAELESRRNASAKVWLHATSEEGLLERRIKRSLLAVAVLFVLTLVSFFLPGAWGSVVSDGVVLALAVIIWSMVPILKKVVPTLPRRGAKPSARETPEAQSKRAAHAKD